MSAWAANSLTVFEKAGKVSRNNLLSVIRIRDQVPQSMELDIMFVIGDHDPC